MILKNQFEVSYEEAILLLENITQSLQLATETKLNHLPDDIIEAAVENKPLSGHVNHTGKFYNIGG